MGSCWRRLGTRGCHFRGGRDGADLLHHGRVAHGRKLPYLGEGGISFRRVGLPFFAERRGSDSVARGLAARWLGGAEAAAVAYALRRAAARALVAPLDVAPPPATVRFAAVLGSLRAARATEEGAAVAAAVRLALLCGPLRALVAARDCAALAAAVRNAAVRSTARRACATEEGAAVAAAVRLAQRRRALCGLRAVFEGAALRGGVRKRMSARAWARGGWGGSAGDL
jgi:hypothetical protein